MNQSKDECGGDEASGNPDPFEFEYNDLPDLETLVWKLMHVPDDLSAFDDDELEFIRHVNEAGCPVCAGTGQDGMTRAGLPIECKTCKGRGR
jgi:hypothetical protein